MMKRHAPPPITRPVVQGKPAVVPPRQSFASVTVAGPGVIQGYFPGGGPRLPASAAGVGARAPRYAVPLPETLHHLGRGGAGKPLPDAVQRKMEGFFGAGFADVRVHVGAEAPAIGALAFTRGNDIYFAPGQYDPSHPQGQQRLGHELAHVVQQRQGRVRNPFGTGIAVVTDPALEAEAERKARSAMMAAVPPPSPAPVGAARTGAIQGMIVKRAKTGDVPHVSTSPLEILLTDELIALIIEWVVGVEKVCDKFFARNYRLMLDLRLIDTRWRRIIDAWMRFGAQYSPTVRELLAAHPDDRLAVGGYHGRARPLLTDVEAWGIHDIARSVILAYPPENHVFISLGNSPSLVMEYIDKTVPEATVVHLPFTALTPLVLFDAMAEYERSGEQESPIMRNLWRYLFNALGKDVFYPKNIVLVDIYVSGAALLTMNAILQGVLTHQRTQEGKPIPRSVIMLALNTVTNLKLSQELEEYADWLGGPEVERLDIVDVKSVSRKTSYMATVQENIVSCIYKNKLLLRLFEREEKHGAALITSGRTVMPCLNAPQYLIMKRLMQLVQRKNASRSGLRQPWVYDPSERAWY